MAASLRGFLKVNALDKAIGQLSPRWGLSRVKHRMALEVYTRHYEAAEPGRRTQGWARQIGDANVANRRALVELRLHVRDLMRNNGWARRGRQKIVNGIVADGMRPRVIGANGAAAMELWKKWADTSQCHDEGRLTMAGLQAAIIRGVTDGGEVLVRRRIRKLDDGLAIPLQLQLLESDFLDHSKDNWSPMVGEPLTIQGIEFDALGRRAAYWVYDKHPGANGFSGASRRILASEIAHVFLPERMGQVRGIPWFAPAVLKLKDFNDFDDATLVRNRIAACFVAFIENPDGDVTQLGATDTVNRDPLVEEFQPGMIVDLPAGRKVSFGQPPVMTEYQSYTQTNLRWIAAAIGVPYESLTGDYSQSNFSSARAANLEFFDSVTAWRRDMLVPAFCSRVWEWAMDAARLAGYIQEIPGAEWTGAPMPMIEPDREARAAQLQVRTGMKTPSEVIREQGYDPKEFLDEYEKDQKDLADRGIVFDSIVAKVTQSGQAQGSTSGGTAGGADEESNAAQDDSKKSSDSKA